jgi:hypothetical protein
VQEKHVPANDVQTVVFSTEVTQPQKPELFAVVRPQTVTPSGLQASFPSGGHSPQLAWAGLQVLPFGQQSAAGGQSQASFGQTHAFFLHVPPPAAQRAPPGFALHFPFLQVAHEPHGFFALHLAAASSRPATPSAPPNPTPASARIAARRVTREPIVRARRSNRPPSIDSPSVARTRDRVPARQFET